MVVLIRAWSLGGVDWGLLLLYGDGGGDGGVDSCMEPRWG